jgi:hypothetical protein
MKVLSLSLVSLLLPLSIAKAQVVVEPDNYANGTELTSIVPQVTLNTTLSDNVPVPLFVVTATDDLFTGRRVFAHVNIPFFSNERRLRMDFAGLVSGLSLEFIAGNALSQHIGRLEAYNHQNALVGTYVTSPLTGSAETMFLSRPVADIAWAVAYSDPSASPFGRLDHLVFSDPVMVPEPSMTLLGGVLVIAFLAARRCHLCRVKAVATTRPNTVVERAKRSGLFPRKASR